MTQAVNKGAIRVFVYGTLKRLHYNHYLLEGSNVHGTKYLGKTYIKGPYRMLSLGNFPGVQFDPLGVKEPQTIYGEVYEIDANTLKSLDILEGNGNFYTRQKVGTPYRNAWIYFLPAGEELAKRYPVIKEGAWHPNAAELAFIARGEEKEDADTPYSTFLANTLPT